MPLNISLVSWRSSKGEDTWYGQPLKMQEIFFFLKA